jgi:hypothetical protein
MILTEEFMAVRVSNVDPYLPPHHARISTTKWLQTRISSPKSNEVQATLENITPLASSKSVI